MPLILQNLDPKTRDLMTPPVATVRASDPIEDAMEVAAKHRVRHLPVVDDGGALVGLLTQTDLLRASRSSGSLREK